MERLLLFAILLLAACSGPRPRFDEPDNLVIKPKPQKSLNIHFTNFVDEHGLEFSFCAYGNIRNNILVVHRVEFPPQRQEKYSVFAHYDLCSDNAIAIGHAHPNVSSNWMYSDVDWNTLRERPEPAGILLYRSQVTDELRTKVFITP